jgi:uncharacterized iron-regulated membrane protein
MKNNRFKSLIGWLHLYLGLTAGIVVIVVALTGGLLAFEDELEPVLFKHRHMVEASSAQRLPVDSLINIAQQAIPGKKVSRVVIDPGADQSVEARVGAKGKLSVVYIDPYNGKVLYKGDYTKQFFQQVRSLHRYLLLGATGKIITGISCSICFFLVISGLILWWPANKKAIKQRFKIKWNASGKRLNWDLHAVTGFYASIFLLLITMTGLVWSYDWIEGLIFKIADGKPQKEMKVKNLTAAKKSMPGVYETMDEAMNKLYPYPGTVAFSIPPAKGGQAVMFQKEPLSSVVRQTDAAYFDRGTGALIKQVPFAKMTMGNKIRRMILPIHTGSLLGWPSKIIALLVALFTASLPITGMIMWLSKRKKKPKQVRGTRKAAIA